MEKYYSVQEAAAEFNLSEKTLKDWLRAGKIKATKAGRAWRIGDSAIREYLKLPSPKSEYPKLNEQILFDEISRLQGRLFAIEESNSGEMSRSKALKVASMLEEIVEYLGYGSPMDEEDAKQIGTATLTPIEMGRNVGDLLDHMVRSSILDTSDDLESEWCLERVKMALAYAHRIYEEEGAQRNITKSLAHLKQLKKKFDACKELARGYQLSWSDQYSLAAGVRRFEELLPDEIKKLEICRSGPAGGRVSRSGPVFDTRASAISALRAQIKDDFVPAQDYEDDDDNEME